MAIKDFLLVGLGGAAGSMLRYGSNLLISNKNFPYATLCINIIGSFIIGLVIAFSLKNESFANNWKLFIATGICGGFTTFSAFSLENLQLIQNGKYFLFALYVFVSVLAGLGAAFTGYKIAA